jgi:hypothetical protein
VGLALAVHRAELLRGQLAAFLLVRLSCLLPLPIADSRIDCDWFSWTVN